MLRILTCTLLLFLGVATARAQEPAADVAPAAESAPSQPAEQPADAPAGDAPEADAPAVDAPAEQPAAPAGPSPEALAAKEAFDVVYRQWNELVTQINAVEAQRGAAQGDARQPLDDQLAALRTQADDLIDKIVEAGLAVYKADGDAYPDINATLLAVAQFYVTGDSNGDGGDQYEKALPLVRSLIDAGGGERWPQLYLWGGTAAYATGELDLAETYYKQAEAAGVFANVPQPTGAEPPTVKLLIDAFGYHQALATHRKHWEQEQKIRAAEAAADDLPRVKFTTTKGDVVIELFENEAPQSVANFITLVKQGFYDGVVFHRVLPLFMAQGGDPEGTGGGGPGYSIPDEHHQANIRHHFRGSLSMAKTAAPNSGGSQFFLTFVPTSYLDGKHTAFGRVIEGMNVAASLKRRDPEAPVGEPDKIIKAEVLRDRGHDYKFDKLPGK